MRKILVLFLVLSLLFGTQPVRATVQILPDTSDEILMYVCSVGKADAILLRVEDHTVLIDTGYPASMGKILYGMDVLGANALDAVFITHLDGDHVGGLDWLAQSDLEIGAWYASAEYMEVSREDKHPVVQAAASRGQSVTFLSAGEEIPLGGAVLRVLCPIQRVETKEDDNSLVMMLESDRGKILLTGDMEYPEERLLMQSGADLACDVLKVANHGDDDTNSPAFTALVSPKLAVISTATAEKAETPDPALVRTLQAQGAEVLVTDSCSGGILIRLSETGPAAELIDVPENDSGVTLTAAIPGEDLIFLRGGETDTDLSGWYLFSSRGNELFVFPEGTTLPGGETLIVGTRTSKGAYDVLWNDKKVIHQKKEDLLLLYDPCGNLISQVSNGLSD